MFKRITARRDERRQILLIAAAGMFVFIALVGLVIDTGVAFRERRNIQNAADLSSLAGTKVIADHYLDGGRTGTEVLRRDHRKPGEPMAAPAANECTWTAVYVRPNPADHRLGGRPRRRDHRWVDPPQHPGRPGHHA